MLVIVQQSVLLRGKIGGRLEELALVEVNITVDQNVGDVVQAEAVVVLEDLDRLTVEVHFEVVVVAVNFQREVLVRTER